MSLLNEARRNPELNVRETIIDAITKYEGDEDIFLSFTSSFEFNRESKTEVKTGKDRQHKIGINPRSTFNTPLGIYCYPVDFILQYSQNRGEVTGPYTGSDPWKFLYVLRRNPSGIIETPAQAEPYYEKLKAMARDEGYESLIRDTETYSKEKNARGFLWYLGMTLASNLAKGGRKPPVVWNGIMRKLGIRQFVDRDNQGLIHSSEPTQAVFFSVESFSVVAVYPKATERSITSKGLMVVREEIIAGTFDFRKFNPFWIKKMSFDSERDDYAKFVSGLSENLGALQRKTVGQILKKRFEEDYLTLELLDLVNKFFPVKITAQLGESIFRFGLPLWELPNVLGRPLQKDEWNKIFVSFAHYSSAPDLKTQLQIIPKDSGLLTREWVITLLQSLFRKADTGMSAYILFEPVLQLCRDNGIELDEEMKKELFTASPKLALDQLGYSPTEFKDWYRAARVNGLSAVAEIIPINFAKLIVTQNKFMNQDRVFLMDRLLQEGGNEDFLIRLLASRDDAPVVRYKASVDMVNFYTRNFDKIVSIDPTALTRFDIVESWKPSFKTLMKMFQYCSNSKSDRSAYIFNQMMKNKWAPPEIFARYLDPAKPDGNLIIMGLLFNYIASNRDYQVIESLPNQIVDAAEQLKIHVNFTSRAHIEYMLEKYPDKQSTWVPIHQLSFIWDLMEKFPDLYNNSYLLNELASRQTNHEKLAQLLIAQKFDFHRVRGPDVRASIIMTQIQDNPRYLLTALVDPTWQPFPPMHELAMHGLDAEMLHTLKGAKLPANLVRQFFERFSLSMCGLFTVDASEAGETALRIIQNYPQAAKYQIFANELSEDELTAIQIRSLDNSYSRYKAIQLDPFVQTIHKPTPAFLAYVEEVKAELSKDYGS